MKCSWTRTGRGFAQGAKGWTRTLQALMVFWETRVGKKWEGNNWIVGQKWLLGFWLVIRNYYRKNLVISLFWKLKFAIK